MNSAKTNWGNLLPVFLSFVVMGFVDIIGVATGYIKQDFKLSDLIVQFLPMMVLLWYFILSVPAGILQDRYGKRKMLNLGMLVQAAGLGLPFIHYSFGMMFASFILLGIGNTVIQVSANPLLQDVSPAERLPSYLSTSQFIKAIISFLGPIIATFFAVSFGNWRLVFAVYGITSVVAALWLSTTRIKESQPFRKPASFSSCFGLLGDRFISLMALSIFLIVGVEVAVNTNIANVLVASYDITFEKAALGISIFFAGETISRFLGAVILNYMRPRLFLLILALLALAGVAGVFLAPVVIVAFISIFILGLGAGSMFPVIFSIALKTNPDRANEISGLLIMAVSGGAVIPLIMGLFITLFGSLASLSVIATCMLYILWVSWYLRDKTAQ